MRTVLEKLTQTVLFSIPNNPEVAFDWYHLEEKFLDLFWNSDGEHTKASYTKELAQIAEEHYKDKR